MKLYNKTKFPTEILKRFIASAGKAVGARINNVIVIVLPARNIARGLAYKGNVYKIPIISKTKWHNTDGGFLKLWFPYHKGIDALRVAEYVYDLCLHEWGHIRDYQEGLNRIFSYKGRHDSRPQEIRADDYKDEALQKIEKGKVKSRDTIILDFAIALEELTK